MLFNEIIEKVTRENVDKITFYMVNNYHHNGKPSVDELVWIQPFIKAFGGRDERGALTSPAGDTTELKIKFSSFWSNRAAQDWVLYRTQWLHAVLYNEYGHEEQSARMASVLMNRPDREHLIAFLSEQFPGNDTVVDLFEDTTRCVVVSSLARDVYMALRKYFC